MGKIYRDYDQAGLDAQYNLRARWPEHVDFMRDWRRDGTTELARPGWHVDLAYGATPSETVDLFVPARPARPPLLLFIHGGYWQALDKRDVDWLAPAFASTGIAFAAPNYALAPQASLDAIVAQLRACLAFLWRNAPALGFDARRIVVAGHSAGGHLAAMAAATDWSRFGALPRDLVQAIVSVSGVYDLAPIKLSYHNAVLKLDARAAARNSPLILAPNPGTRVMATVGGDETPEFHRQQAEFVAAWRKSGARVDVIEAPGLHHFDIVAKCADFAHPIGRAISALCLGRSRA